MIQPAACAGPAAPGQDARGDVPRPLPPGPLPRPRTHDALLGVLRLGDDHGRAARLACRRPRRALAPAGGPVELQAVLVAAATAAAAAAAALGPLALPAGRATALPGPGTGRAVARARLLPGRRRLLPGHGRAGGDTGQRRTMDGL